jgi:hypothetical protein
MRIVASFFILLVSFAAPYAIGQQPSTLADLDALSPAALTRQELLDLVPNAKVSRVITNGNLHIWINDPDGTFIVSSDNRATNGVPATGRGKWHITDDGRYCIFIQWRTNSEEWCRFVLNASGTFYTAKSLKPGTEKIYKLDFKK